MRSILLHINEDACVEARLRVALDLARSLDGQLTCLQVTSFDFAMPGDFYGTMLAEVLPKMREQAEAARERISARLETEQVAWEWIAEDGIAADQVLRHGALADVIVLGACDPVSADKRPSSLAGPLAIRSRTPVLVVPEDTLAFSAEAPMVVAWNGSPEAAHALKAARPLLANAATVLLATVHEDNARRSDKLSLDEGAAYLARHGIASEPLELARDGRSTPELLAEAATARNAACLVMGAYGRSRAIEATFGGVTHELLSNPPLPILMSH